MVWCNCQEPDGFPSPIFILNTNQLTTKEEVALGSFQIVNREVSLKKSETNMN